MHNIQQLAFRNRWHSDSLELKSHVVRLKLPSYPCFSSVLLVQYVTWSSVFQAGCAINPSKDPSWSKERNRKLSFMPVF